jgi:hypothetical protein
VFFSCGVVSDAMRISSLLACRVRFFGPSASPQELDDKRHIKQHHSLKVTMSEEKTLIILRPSWLIHHCPLTRYELRALITDIHSYSNREITPVICRLVLLEVQKSIVKMIHPMLICIVVEISLSVEMSNMSVRPVTGKFDPGSSLFIPRSW